MNVSLTCDCALPRKQGEVVNKIVYALFKIFIRVSIPLEQEMAAYIFHRLSESPEQEVGLSVQDFQR